VFAAFLRFALDRPGLFLSFITLLLWLRKTGDTGNISQKRGEQKKEKEIRKKRTRESRWPSPNLSPGVPPQLPSDTGKLSREALLTCEIPSPYLC
jgi:hypothetical protein